MYRNTCCKLTVNRPSVSTVPYHTIDHSIYHRAQGVWYVLYHSEQTWVAREIHRFKYVCAPKPLCLFVVNRFLMTPPSECEAGGPSVRLDGFRPLLTKHRASRTEPTIKIRFASMKTTFTFFWTLPLLAFVVSA